MELSPLPLFTCGRMCGVILRACSGQMGPDVDCRLNKIVTWEMPFVQLLPI